MRGFAAFSVALMAVSILGACGDDDDAMPNATATQATAATVTQPAVVETPPISPAPSDSGTIGVGDGGVTLEEALREAGARAGFAPSIPTRFPTAANRPTEVRWNAIRGTGQVTIQYVSEEMTDAGVPEATLEVFLPPNSSVAPVGTLLGEDLAGYEVYELLQPGSASYLAFDYEADFAVILQFRGELPTLEGLEEMLGSFVVADSE
jgi:hypothetical protein